LLDRVRAGLFEREALVRDMDDLGAEPEAGSEVGTKRAHLVALRDRADELHATMIFPLLGSAETEQGPWLLGLFCLRDDRTDNAFDADDIETFRQLAIGAARVIESSQAYERVKERDRLAALGEMSAGLAHEIRNPLGAIKGAAQLLITADGKPATPSAETVELLEIIVEEANRLNNVVTRFLDYARAERPGREGGGKFDLNLVVRKTVQLIQNDLAKSINSAALPNERSGERTLRGMIDLRVRIDEMLPQIAGDPESLLQVFLNLGQNAIQAMPEGGTLEILTTRRRRSRLGYGQFAEVRIRDTGIGIPRDRLKKLFIPFYTTKQKGTGLGLAISHRIVNQHGGTIEVRSTLGQGSTFSVFLPAAEPVPVGKIEDITETGRLTSLGSLARTTLVDRIPVDRGDTPVPTPPVVPPDESNAVGTVGRGVESISPASDSMSDMPAMRDSNLTDDDIPPAVAGSPDEDPRLGPTPAGTAGITDEDATRLRPDHVG
nr:hypothetical protein [Deltaproteobacteria bacterium]